MEKELTNRRWFRSPKEKKDKEAIVKLADRAKYGSRDALKTLCEAIAKSVLFHVSCSLHNEMDAEDVTQEILIRVCENIHNLRDTSAFSTWLNSIIVNEIRRYAAKGSKRGVVINLDEYFESDIEEEEDQEFLPEDYAVREEDRRVVMDIVKSLPERQLEAVILHYYKGLGITETAKTMDVTKQSVARYLKLAREKIKKEIDNTYEKTGTLQAIALLPIGGLLSNIMKQEATLATPLSNTWVDSVVNKYTKVGSSGLTTGVVKGLVGKIAVAVVSVAIITTGTIYIVSELTKKEDSKNLSSVSQSVETYSEITFSGGTNEVSINPTNASVTSENIYGALTAKEWSIYLAGNESIIYAGKNDNLNGTLTLMQETGENGIYILCYLMEDTTGNMYKVTREFTIQK